MEPALASPDRLLKRIPRFLDAVRFQESVFALPFAYSGMVLAANGLPAWEKILWITVAMVSARTLGMSANRIIDRTIDAQNPRTAMRHLPAGLLRLSDMVALSLIAGVVFFIAAALLNPLALTLAPVAAAYLIFYPYTKRFTWAASFFLGWALAIAPSAAWIGVQGSLAWAPVVLSTSVALWAAGFDILYHAQDKQFYADRGSPLRFAAIRHPCVLSDSPDPRRTGRLLPANGRRPTRSLHRLLRRLRRRRRCDRLQVPHGLPERPFPYGNRLHAHKRLRLPQRPRRNPRRRSRTLTGCPKLFRSP